MRSTSLVLASILSVAFGGVSLAVGCSSSSGGASPQADGGDAAAADVAAEGAADAGADNEQDPDVYPARHQPIPQIDYNGGPILQHVRLVTVTFNGDKHRDTLRDFDHFITTSSWWQQTDEGYCVPDGGVCVGNGTASAPDGGTWLPDGSTADAGDGSLDVELPYDFGDAGASIDDSQIQTWLSGHVAAGDFPAADGQTLYVLYFPVSTTITLQGQTSCVAFGGYHNSGSAAADGGSQELAYAVIPFCDYGQGDAVNFQQLTIVASHEIAEAATDPNPETTSAFYLHSNDAWLGALSYGGGENGDMCTYVNDETYNESGYTVQRIWSNQAAAQSKQPCQPWDTPYFAAAVRTPPFKTGHGTSDGYVVAKRGQSTDVIADVFSEKALAHDLTLYAGVPKYGATDPSNMSAPPDYITVDMSTQQVHNGNGVVLTFNVPAKASPGDYRMVIRAVLSSTDFNDWPVIVHVQ